MQRYSNYPRRQGTLSTDLPPLTNIFQWIGFQGGRTGCRHKSLMPLSFSKSNDGSYQEAVGTDTMNGPRNFHGKRFSVTLKEIPCRGIIGKPLISSSKSCRRVRSIILILRKNVFWRAFRNRISK